MLAIRISGFNINATFVFDVVGPPSSRRDADIKAGENLRSSLRTRVIANRGLHPCLFFFFPFT